MNKVVVDASVSIKWVTEEPFHDAALVLLGKWIMQETTILAPILWQWEVDSYFRRNVFRRRMSADVAATAQRALDGFFITVRHSSGLRVRAREIAERANQERVYDSVYAALAESEGCELWTADEAFWKAVNGFLPFVKYLGDVVLQSVHETPA